MLFHKIKFEVLCASIVFIYGCATSYAPDNWLPNTDQIEREAYGGWLTLYCNEDSVATSEKEQIMMGEFIACDSTMVFLLSGEDLIIIYKENIVESILELDDKNTGEYAAWTALGTLSTISHGYYAGISFPLWLIVGISASSGESLRDRYVEELPADTYWEEVQKFARFPQGIPPNLDLNELKPKSNPGIQYD